MINLIIFTRDRACQLNLLLESLQKYSNNIFDTTVLYKFTNEEYSKGYQKVQSNFSSIKFVQEIDFYQDVLHYSTISDYSHTCFGVDDDVMYKCVPTKPPELNISEVFSFRLGSNVLMQNHIDKLLQPPLNRYIENNGILKWNINEYNPDQNYGYPFSVDFHVFHVNLLKTMFKTCSHFNNPTEFESRLVLNFRYLVSFLSSFKESVIVNIPMNNMSNITQVNSNSYTTEFLNSQFLSGKRIDLEGTIGYNKIVGTHQNFELVFADFE